MPSKRSITYDLTASHELKALEALTAQAKPPYLVHSVLIVHVLSTAERYIELIHSVFPVQLVIAIPYSADRATLKKLESKGIRTYLPSTIEEAFSASGPLIEKILANDSTPLVVQEVGGYLAGHTESLSRYPHFRGIVEDTNNGHWRYQSVGKHPCPVLSMAKSPIKDIEDTIIGDSAVFSTERVFREDFNAILQGCSAGVIGYGKIGTSTAVALRGRECQVSIYDINPTKNIRARFEGFSILPLRQLLSNCDLVIGCTGQTSLHAEDIPFIKPNAVLVSASAKDEEFNLRAFAKECEIEALSDAVWRYIKKDGSCFYLLHKGTPINFRDRSVLGHILDLIYCELFVCMQVVAYEKLGPGLQESYPEIHARIAKTWLTIYEEPFQQEKGDKMWLFPQGIEFAYPKTYALQVSQRQPVTTQLSL